MRPSLLIASIQAMVKVGRSVYVAGKPGNGKSTICHTAVRGIEGGSWGYREIHGPTMLVEDMGILFPNKTDDKLSYRLADWWPIEGECEEQGVLCFDDRDKCDINLQKVIANIQQARHLHGHKLPDGWSVIATGNRLEDRSGSARLLGHLANRETQITLEANLPDFSAWGLDNGVNPILLAYLQMRPDQLHDYDPNREQNPSPRSWVEGVSNLIGIVPAEAQFEVFKGSVGEGAAAEFTGFMKIWRDLPSIESILRSPDTADVPSEGPVLYALAGAIAEAATIANFDGLIRYVNRLPKEFGAITVSFAARKNVDLTDTKAFNKWAVVNHDLLF